MELQQNLRTKRIKSKNRLPSFAPIVGFIKRKRILLKRKDNYVTETVDKLRILQVQVSVTIASSQSCWEQSHSEHSEIIRCILVYNSNLLTYSMEQSPS
jgi:hypothetical protein